jgi:hypothetical protein
MDYYLKAASEAALMTALEAVDVVKSYAVKNEQGETITTRYATQPGYNLDVIGTIYKPTGNLVQRTVGESTVEVPEMETLTGFHANLRGPANLAPTVTVTPYTPTTKELADPDFVQPEPTTTTTPSPIQDLLVYPQSPSRVWF